MQMGRRSGGNNRQPTTNPAINNNNRRRAILNERRVTDSLRENKVDSFNPLIQHREGIKSTVTYYQAITEANDSDTDPEFSLEKLNTISSTATIYTVPGPMIPKPQDMIHLQTTDIDITLKFTEISPIIHSQDSGYQIAVESYTIGLSEELSSRIEGEFVFDFVNVGTNKTTIIEKSIYGKLMKLYDWLDDLQDSYDMLFWNDNLGAYVYQIPIDLETETGNMLKQEFIQQYKFGPSDEYFSITDPYNNKFIKDSGFFVDKSPSLHIDKRKKDWMLKTFNRSIYGALIDRKEQYMMYRYPFIADYYNTEDFQIISNQIHLETLYVEYLTNIRETNTALSYLIDSDYYPITVINAIKNKTMDNTNMYKVVQDVIHNESSKLFDSENIEYFEALLDYTILSTDPKDLANAYYLAPLLTYSLLYTINEVILKDATNQTIYDQRIMV